MSPACSVVKTVGQPRGLDLTGLLLVIVGFALTAFGQAHAHGVATGDQAFLKQAQVLALIVLMLVFSWVRLSPHFTTIARNTNLLLFGAGLVLFGMHAVGFFLL